MAAPTGHSSDEVARLAFDEAVRTLQHQDQEVNTIRQNAVRIASLAGGSTVLAAISTLLSNKPAAALIALLAIATFLLLLLLLQVWGIYQPIQGFYVEVDARKILKYDAKDADAMYRKLAEYYGKGQESNEEKMVVLRSAYMRALVLGAAQILFWVATAWVAVFI